LPGSHFSDPKLESIQHFGYGIPSLNRVIKNTEYRVTFYNTGSLKVDEANIYSLKIPKEIRGQGDEYDILIEVTLAYTAKTRRTRQKTKSYLSTWLDWTSSDLDEGLAAFTKRSIELSKDEIIKKTSSDVIQWNIRERDDWGVVNDINRNNSTLQKDWVILKSYQLPVDLSFAVRALKGWDKNHEPVPYAFTVSIEILGANIPIYEMIRVENPIEVEV
jgi:hypothetical protein